MIVEEDVTETKILDFVEAIQKLEIPESLFFHAKLRLLDSIGVAIAALDEDVCRAVRRLAPEIDGCDAVAVWGDSKKTTPEMAAFVNGVMVRALNYNDALRTLDAIHPSDYLPAVMAVAVSNQRLGIDLLRALIVHYELLLRFNEEVPFNLLGWDQPVVGGIGTAVAAGILLGLERWQMRNAIALSVIPNLCTFQTRSGALSQWQACAAANGARNGIFAAYLAAEGVTAPQCAFDGEYGIWRQAAGGESYSLDFSLKDSGDDWGIKQTTLKRFPIRDSCQLPIDVALDVRASVSASDIRKIVVETYEAVWFGAAKDRELWSPASREEADHSLPFAIACAILDGDLSLQTFKSGRFLDGDVRDLMSKTSVVVDPEFERAVPATRNCRIRAVLMNGEEHVFERGVNAKDIGNSMQLEEVQRKFDRNAENIFDRNNRNKIIDLILALDHNSNPTQLDNALIANKL